MVLEILRAFGFIFIAEMGDKSQILAIAFATKYDIKKVLLGILIGAFLNHAIAVVLGNLFSQFVAVSTISIIAGLAFILFALWTLRLNESDESLKKKSKYGPVITVALAFFIGELGDKTQLAAITLSASSKYPAYILFGTVSAMLVTSAIAIYIGIKLGNKIPEFFIKLSASLIFFTVGFIKLYSSLPSQLDALYLTIPFTLLTLGTGYMIFRPSIELRRKGQLTALQKSAELLHEFYYDLSKRLEDICLGTDICGECSGRNCLVGYTKSIIKKALNNEEIQLEYFEIKGSEKVFDKAKIIESLRLLLDVLSNHPNQSKYIPLHQTRKNYERILFGYHIDDFRKLDDYLSKVEQMDRSIAKKLRR